MPAQWLAEAGKLTPELAAGSPAPVEEPRQPLDVVGTPDSPYATLMPEAIRYNLDYVIENQADDGSWRPAWNWGDAFPDAWPEAERQWSGAITLERLKQLSAYGRIEGG